MQTSCKLSLSFKYQEVVAAYNLNRLRNLQENAHKFLLSFTTITLEKDQGHPNCYQTVEFSDVRHLTKFEEIGLQMSECRITLFFFFFFFLLLMTKSYN